MQIACCESIFKAILFVSLNLLLSFNLVQICDVYFNKKVAKKLKNNM